jgi:hypothetical protein
MKHVQAHRSTGKASGKKERESGTGGSLRLSTCGNIRVVPGSFSPPLCLVCAWCVRVAL